MKNKWIWIVLILALGGGGFAYWRTRDSESVTYREVKVHKGDLELSILSTGTVQPENRLEIKPPIAGRIEKVLVDEGKVVRKGQILAWMSSTERAAMLDAARAKGKEETKRWEEMYQPTPILAPINGMIILRNIESGQTITNTDAVLVMSDRLTVKAQVDETDLAQIKLKQDATIVLDAYPSEKIPAVVDQIAYEAKTVNNVTTYLVDVLPVKAPEMMRSGMTANVNFATESRKDALLVSTEAVRTGEGKPNVLVRGPSGEPTEREISIGLSDGKRTEVTEGLAEGDVVLIAQAKAKEKGVNPFMPKRPPRNSAGGGAKTGKGGG
ncbi:MAG: efflux RND transporter periplasmic adaptor subunit [Bdellovibrionales bacterium]|nr:efflux RND transporter periplasmic adaptor subunit [Bdellovibrionales bacterium]